MEGKKGRKEMAVVTEGVIKNGDIVSIIMNVHHYANREILSNK